MTGPSSRYFPAGRSLECAQTEQGWLIHQMMCRRFMRRWLDGRHGFSAGGSGTRLLVRPGRVLVIDEGTREVLLDQPFLPGMEKDGREEPYPWDLVERVADAVGDRMAEIRPEIWGVQSAKTSAT